MEITITITADTITALAKSETASAYRFTGARASDCAAQTTEVKNFIRNFLFLNEVKT
jgi:vacuolar-type H+-ATPase subunit F/Vma7